jgi:hypothetical protein
VSFDPERMRRALEESGVEDAFAERGGAAVPPSTPVQIVGPSQEPLPPDVLEAAGKRLSREQVARRERWARELAWANRVWAEQARRTPTPSRAPLPKALRKK